MATPSEINDAISENATGPKSMTVDGATATQHSLNDQLNALERIEERAARNKTTLPVRLAKIRPGGPV